MMKILAVVVAIAVLAGIVAYKLMPGPTKPASQNTTTTTVPPAEQSPPPPAQPRAAAEEQSTAVVALQNRLDELEADKPGILTQAQGDEVCGAFKRLIDYEDLERKIRSTDLSRSDFGAKLKAAIGTRGRRAASLAYTKMKAGEVIACGGGEGHATSADLVEQAARWMDKYGSESERFEPSVVRNAYLRAILPLIKESVGEFADNPESEDSKGSLLSLIESAQKWQFSIDDLGIPPEIRKKLGL